MKSKADKTVKEQFDELGDLFTRAKENDEGRFSWSQCERCNTPYAGHRFDILAIKVGTLAMSKKSGPYAICTNCYWEVCS